MLNTVLITVIPKILIGLQIIGTVYMLYLAYQIYKIDSSNPTDNKTVTFISGILMQYLNPKVVIFTLTVVPSFILPYYTDVPRITISVIAITLIRFFAFIMGVIWHNL